MNTGVDRELLADFVGGALSGTPEEHRVAGLISADPSWARAHDELVVADAQVRGWLAAAPPVGPVPPEVIARLDAALAGLPSPSTSRTDAVTMAAPGRRRDHRRSPATRSVDRVEGRRPGGRRRWLPAIGAALGVVLAVILGVQLLPTLQSQSDRKATNASGGSAEAPALDSSGGGTAFRATGTNYTPLTLPAIGARVSSSLANPDKGAPGSTVAPIPTETAAEGAKDVPPALARLRDAAAVDGCLGVLRTATDPPGSVLILYDLAYYEGAPAAIVLRITASAIDRVYVVGPNCGLTGADLRYAR
jgi:hypothetical protein